MADRSIEGVTRLLLENLQLQNEEEHAAANRKDDVNRLNLDCQ